MLLHVGALRFYHWNPRLSNGPLAFSVINGFLIHSCDGHVNIDRVFGKDGF
jgi:hypothetical protein